jgi:hypothetical protein
MKMQPQKMPFMFGITAILAAAPFEALAYIDPGTGSMVLQLLLGGFAGAMVIGKLYWHQFLSFFKSDASTTMETGEDDEQQKNQND